MSRDVGEQFVAAIAAKDRDGLIGLLAESIDFRGMTPRRFWEATTPPEVVDEIILRHWFEPADTITEIVSITSTGQVGDTEHLAYRLRMENPEGSFILEQQAYYTVEQGKIDWLRVMCSGTRPDDQAAPRSGDDPVGRACRLPNRPRGQG